MTLKTRKLFGGIALRLSQLLFVLLVIAFPVITAYATYSNRLIVFAVAVYLLFLGTIVPQLVFALALPLIRSIYEIGHRLSSESAEDLLQDPQFRPIVYLRSFSVEKEVSAEERALFSMLRNVGPFVAIGRPSEWAPRLGAYRLYLKDSEWKAAVGALMKRSLLVVILAGTSDGLRWELEFCHETLNPNHIIILISDDAALFQVFADTFSSATGLYECSSYPFFHDLNNIA
jgi:hypothetical protein